jgi:site-specific DNA-methyltransferase (adenine-specific)
VTHTFKALFTNFKLQEKREMTYKILHGNNLDVLPTLADNSVDSIVTDPPYELGFMGKKWDSSGIAYSVELWQQCLRVLKPGGHLLSFGGTRTYHRVAVAIEDAGFELRDSIAWLYGSGFPKSLDVSKAIDKQAGAEREVLGRNPNSREQATKETNLYELGTVGKTAFDTAPSTPEAQQWQGWGTALKPAFEPVIVARKPIEGTVANNVLKWGTGGLNIDGSRIGRQDGDNSSAGNRTATFGSQDTNSGGDGSGGWTQNDSGRWPANIILDPYTAELLDEQSGTLKSGAMKSGTKAQDLSTNSMGAWNNRTLTTEFYSSEGGASRFFYVAKASKRDRNEGLEELEEKQATEMTGRSEGSAGLLRVRDDGSVGENPYAGKSGAAKNFHPTVKPTSLMEYLIKLVTPPNGTVLDPFTGSGSTGKAAILQGFDFIGIEMTEEYLPIIEGRLKHAEHIVAERNKEASLLEQEKLF